MTSSFAEKEKQTPTSKVVLSDKQEKEDVIEEELPDADFLEFLTGMDDASDAEFNAWLKALKAIDTPVNTSQTEKNN